MSVITQLIAQLDNKKTKEELLERFELVQHKIKFMDPIPVCFLDSMGNPNIRLAELVLAAGGSFTNSPLEGVYVVFFEQGKSLEDLMRNAPVALDSEWQAMKFNRVCLLADDYQLSDAEDVVNLIEDLAEMLHPGSFIFGSEGDKWIRFTV